MVKRHFIRSATSVLAGSGIFFASGALVRAAITADSYVSYTAGDFAPTNSSLGYQNPLAALGDLNGNTGFGGLTPFNPPFSTNQIVIIGAGGHLRLHLASPGPGTGTTLGVFSNNGIVDLSMGGSGVAGNPATTFTDPDFPMAIVKVSQLGDTFVPLNGGNPISFTNPTNYYLDSSINNYFQPLGTIAADAAKPFLGTLASFNGQNYAQMLQTLNGSAGGTWLDLSGTGLAEVNFVEFSVPLGAEYRMVIDSVSTVPEPGAGAALAIGLLLLKRGRTKRV